jgi:hypothetical protein
MANVEKKELKGALEGSQRIKFNFKRPDDYKIHFVNGAYGGLTPHGDILCEFYFEYKALPQDEKATIINGNLVLDEQKNLTEVELTREFKVGVILTTIEAKNIANWLNNKAEEFRSNFVKE